MLSVKGMECRTVGGVEVGATGYIWGQGWGLKVGVDAWLFDVVSTWYSKSSGEEGGGGVDTMQ